MRGQSIDALALEQDAASSGPEEARDQVEEGGLASAVGADEAGDGAPLNG